MERSSATHASSLGSQTSDFSYLGAAGHGKRFPRVGFRRRSNARRKTGASELKTDGQTPQQQSARPTEPDLGKGPEAQPAKAQPQQPSGDAATKPAVPRKTGKESPPKKTPAAAAAQPAAGKPDSGKPNADQCQTQCR